MENLSRDNNTTNETSKSSSRKWKRIINEQLRKFMLLAAIIVLAVVYIGAYASMVKENNKFIESFDKRQVKTEQGTVTSVTRHTTSKKKGSRRVSNTKWEVKAKTESGHTAKDIFASEAYYKGQSVTLYTVNSSKYFFEMDDAIAAENKGPAKIRFYILEYTVIISFAFYVIRSIVIRVRS